MHESIQLVIDSLPYLLKGAVFTLQLSIGGMFFGLVLGFILALMRLSPLLPVRWLARFYISIFRGTPLIAQLFMIYYGLPQFGIETVFVDPQDPDNFRKATTDKTKLYQQRFQDFLKVLGSVKVDVADFAK